MHRLLLLSCTHQHSFVPKHFKLFTATGDPAAPHQLPPPYWPHGDGLCTPNSKPTCLQATLAASAFIPLIGFGVVRCVANTDTHEQATVMACHGNSTHATLTRNMLKSPTCTAVGQAFLFPTRTYPSQGLNLKQAAEGADNMSHRTCPIGPMAPGIKDSLTQGGRVGQKLQACNSCKQCYGTCSLPP